MKSEITKESNQWLETATDTYKVPRDSVLIDWSRIKNGPELRILLIDKTQRKANDALKILFEENKDQITSKKRNLLSFKDGTIIETASFDMIQGSMYQATKITKINQIIFPWLDEDVYKKECKRSYDIILRNNSYFHLVPEEFRIIRFDPFSDGGEENA